MSNFIETFRGRVTPQECDHLGHMNVQFYIAKVSDAAWTVMHAIGMTPDYIRTRRKALAAVRQDVSYLRELKAGDLVVIESGVLEAGETKVTFYHRMNNVETGVLAMTAKVLTVNMDLDKRRAAPLAPEIRERAQAYRVREEGA